MLPHRVLILAVLLLVWCVAIVTTTWAAIVGGLANPDVAAYLNGIQLWQRGARLYEDFLEVNPPAVFFVYLPGVWLSKLAGVPLREGLYAWVSVLALCSSCTVGVLLGRAGGRFAPFEVALVAAVTVYVLFRMVGVDFAERDHLVLLLALPYVVQVGLTADGLGVQPGLRALCLVAMAGAILLKPHYVALWIGVEAYLAWVRGARTLARRDNWLLGALLAAVTGALLIAYPGYLRNVVPLAMSTYHAYDTATFWSDPRLYEVLLGGVTVLAAVGSSRGDRLTGALSVAAFASVFVYWLQGKGWYYHARPFQGFIVVLVAVAAGRVARAIAGGTAEPLVQYAAFVFAAAAFIATTDARSTQLLAWDERRSPQQTNRLVESLLRLPPGSTVLAFTAENFVNSAILQAGLIQQSSFPCYWPIPAAYRSLAPTPRAPLVYHSPAEMSPAERETSRRMLSDLARRPHALVFDQRVGRERFGRSGFKWLDYVKSFPEAAAVLREYRPVLRGGAYELWVRSDVPDRGPDPSTTGPAHQAGVSPLEGDAG